MTTVAITGNTYPVREQIKALGGRWNADSKAWMVPAAKADDARKLVSSAPAKTISGGKRHSSKCAECGRPSRGYYRCYYCSLSYRDGGERHKGGQSYYDRNGAFVLGDDD